MTIIGLMIFAIGFIPAFATAGATDGCFTVIDYGSAFLGFCVGALIIELKYEH